MVDWTDRREGKGGAKAAVWVLEQSSFEGATEAASESRFALSNGSLGIRGSIEEMPGADPSTYLAGVYERTAIHYHERLSGFAATTDTRIPVASGLRLSIVAGGEDISTGEIVRFSRQLDLRRGVLVRRTRWRLASGHLVDVTAERVVPFALSAVAALRLTVESVNFSGTLRIVSAIAADQPATGQGDDPRIGAALEGGGLATEATATKDGPAALSQRTRNSAIGVVCAQTHEMEPLLNALGATATADGVEEIFTGELREGAPVRFEKFIAYACGDQDAPGMLDKARADVRAAAHTGMSALMAGQTSELAQFWRDAGTTFEAAPAIEQALHFNLFHIYQAVSRTPEHSVAAKGLSGEGYEGHYFWDTEAFVFPVVVLTAPSLARQMLEYRYRTLEAARAHARELNFPSGALYAWRTISGAECSAHYPSGSAQFHINAAIAFAIRLYDRATGDEAFVLGKGAQIVFETARIWMQLGHFNHRRGGAFCIDGVTGPDEYTVIVDNNYYTNKMARMHLRYAVELAGRCPSARPDAADVLAWRRAADAMYLPLDAELGVNPQDDTFLDKQPWDFAHTPADCYPLLLHYHPLTLYRRQVCKQADVVLAMVLAGEDVPLEDKRRNYDYYEPLTTHDSTLSRGTFAILASEIGRPEAARSYFEETLFTDLGDLHDNTSHGVHMAAMAGSWLALSWGFGGLRCGDHDPTFSPTLPARCPGYEFAIVWRGSRLKVSVRANAVEYLVTDGPDLSIHHFGSELVLKRGVVRHMPVGTAAERT